MDEPVVLDVAADVVACLRARKDVVLSAHVGFTEEQLRGWEAVARESGARFGVGNPWRFEPGRLLIAQHIEAGKLGRVGLVRVHRWLPVLERGVLVCDLDLVTWYFGTAPQMVFAVECGASRSIHLGFPDGGMALLDHSACVPPGQQYQALSVIGSAGAACADDLANRQLLFGAAATQAIASAAGETATAALVQAFARGLTPALDHWHRVLGWADAVHEALRTRQAVAL